MVVLKSVDKPAAAPQTTAETAPVRKVQPGSDGAAGGPASRAASAFQRVGKSDRPLRPRVRPAQFGIESIIGPDERERILETDLSPWRRICALRLFGPTGGAAVGTGWFVGPRTIVTAGHCVHHQPFFGGWAARIEVSPGRDAQELPFGTIEATRFSALDRWVEHGEADFDIGCIHLDEPIGDAVGCFGFAALAPEDLTAHLVNISGYPADRGNGEQQLFAANRILHVSERRIFYDIDTFGGQSGSPVWIVPEPGAEPVAVAIHAYGTGGTPFDLGITANSAPRITPEIFDVIAGWLKEDALQEDEPVGAC